MTPLAPRPFPHLYNSARESSLEAVSIQDFYEFMLSLETVFFSVEYYFLNFLSRGYDRACLVSSSVFCVIFFNTT